MSNEAPYIGSKISLISKAEIRYEGVLYAVDTKEATVTLAKVRSFGTEDRPVTKHIPPRNETYEFIIFRGSDIKDLHVSDVPKQDELPQDPAILSAQSMRPVTTSSSTSALLPPLPQVPQLQGHFPHTQPALRPQGPQSQTSTPSHHIPPLLANSAPPPTQPTYNPFPPPSMGGYNPFGMPSYFRPSLVVNPSGHLPHRPPLHHQPPAPVLPMAVHAPPPPLSATPPKGITSATPPTSSPSTSTPVHAPPVVKLQPQASSTPQVSIVTQLVAAPRSAQTTSKGPMETASMEAPPSAPMPIPAPELAPTIPLVRTSEAPPVTMTTAAMVPSRTENKAESPPPPPSQTEEMREQENVSQRETVEQPLLHASGGASSRRRPNSGPSRGGGGYRGGYRGGGGRRNYYRGRSNQDKPVYRYDREFDFESANARFNKDDLEQEFKQKLRVEDSESKSRHADTPLVADVDEVDQNGEEEREEAGREDLEFYDKSKSFFDNISHESKSGGGRRPNWNEERELNTETFGVGSVYRGYRRGWGRGRGRGGRGWRGGNRYYGNYRGRGRRWGQRGDRGDWGQERGGGKREEYPRSGASSSHGYQPRRRNYATAEK